MESIAPSGTPWIEELPRRGEREREGVHERGEAVPLGGAPIVGGKNLAAPRDPEGGQAVAHRRGVEGRRPLVPEEPEQLEEKLLQEMLGERQRVRQDLAEGEVEGERAGKPLSAGGCPQHLRQLEEQRRLSDVGRSIDHEGGADAPAPLQRRARQGGELFLAPEKIFFPKGRFRPHGAEKTQIPHPPSG
jgi:hypothetical protein